MNSLFRPEAVEHNTRRLAGEVLLAAPLPAKLIGLLLAALVLAAAIFAGFATYARTASLSGWLIPDRGLIRAAAPATGLIQKVLVTEGDVVPEGQRLAQIALAAETEGGNAGETHARGLLQETAALKAHKAAAIARLKAEEEQTRARIVNFGGELQQAGAQISFQERRLKLAQKQAAAAEQLTARGTLSARDLEQRQSAMLAIDLELSGLRRQASAIQREIADGKARLAAIPIEIDAAQADSLSAEASLKERTSDAESRRAVFVLAPMGGRIAALPVASGQPVMAGATLVVMTPADGRLEAELLAPSRAIGFIREGQEVRLQLQAFPYQRFGTLAGKVKTVSGTVLGPSEISIPGLAIHEPVFRVRVSLAAEEIVAYGQHHSLQPGMLLTAEIVLDRQNLLRWLFDPLYAVSRKT
ncbi:MAG: HlyD family efflux transporter periplasmic adaptor subunit [Rhodomicrobium sp.]